MRPDAPLWPADRAHGNDASRYLAELERRGRDLNAIRRIIHPSSGWPQAVRRQVDGTARGELAGLPFGVKENIAVEGVPTTAGMRPEPPPATVDSVVVARLRSVGAMPVAQCAMDEAAFGGTTDNPHYGRTLNPRAGDRTPGGSSGGSAALVAAGLVPFALGTDTLGSVRIPAAYCGVAGFKPSRGRISLTGVLPLAPSLDHVGVLADSVTRVRDVVAAAFGWQAGDPTTWPQSSITAPGRAALGILDAAARAPLTPSAAAAFGHALRRLERAGWPIENVAAPALDISAARKAAFLIMEAEGAEVHAQALADPDSPLSPRLRRLLAFGRDCGSGRLTRAHAVLDSTRRALAVALETAPWLLLPTCPQTAFRFDDPVPTDQADFTALANIAGLPAISLPCGNGDDGLPVGLQIVGRAGADEALLDLAGRIERVLDAAS